MKQILLLTFLSVVIFSHMDSRAQNSVADSISKVTQIKSNSEYFFIEDEYKGKKYFGLPV